MPGRFLLKLFLFSLPIFIIIGFPFWVLYRSGELMSDSQIVAQMATAQASATASAPSDAIVGLAYTNPVDYLNLQSVIAEKPEVLVIGSSRVGQIRSTFFTPTTTVYIASGLQKISHFRHFLDDIPTSSTPRVMIVGLDEKFFDPAYDSLAPDNIDALLTQPFTATDVLTNWTTVYHDYAAGKFTIGGLLRAPSSTIGLSAIVQDAGYRVDGSRQTGTIWNSPANPASSDYEFHSTFSEIAEGIDGFEHSSMVSQSALDELDTFLADCQARHITVIGFLTPFAPDVYQKLMSLPAGQYGFLKPLPQDVSNVFTKHGFAFYNFMDPTPLGITDAEVQDGVHMTERGTLKFFLTMAEQGSSLRQYVDLAALGDALTASSTTQYDVMPPNPGSKS
jgi:hypothetical protein